MARYVTHSKDRARKCAQEIADTAARPVWWRQEARRAFSVDVMPHGEENEMLFLAVPNDAARARQTYIWQVRNMHRSLVFLAKNAPPPTAVGLRMAAGYLLDKSRLTAAQIRDIEDVSAGRKEYPPSPEAPSRVLEGADAEIDFPQPFLIEEKR